MSEARTAAAGSTRAPRVITLPDPSLVVLVGAAGSGKSTLARRLVATDAVLSSDAHRALVTGDETDQGATRTAFAILHRRLVARLAAGLTTLVDATNVTPYARRGLVRRARDHDVPAIAIVLDLPETEVLARNATRPGRIVPEAAVRRQLDDLARSLRQDALSSEGFAAVHVLRSTAEVDALAIERLSPARPR